MSDSTVPGSGMSDTHAQLLNRIEKLERANRRMRLAAGMAALAVAGAGALGFQAVTAPAPKPADPVVINADEVRARTIVAGEFIVRTPAGEIRLDRRGLLIKSPTLHTINRSKIVEFDNRIEIGFVEDWAQDNLYQPTPRVAVGRWAKDTSDNLVTRITNVSPEGVHSGEWHTNNPRHDGRTDRDLIEALQSRR